MASIDATPTRDGSDLYLTLGCLDSQRLGYLWPYDQQPIPANVDEYQVGIWDASNRVWVDLAVKSSVILTEDGMEVYIANRASLREIVRLLKMSASGLPSDQYLNAVAYDSGTDGIDYWSEFDAGGVIDALGYLGCH